MATSFNAMLDALEVSVGELDASVRAQRQLVADASHELRTPITSLRTNVEILRTRSARALRAASRRAARHRRRADRGAQRADERRHRAGPRRPADARAASPCDVDELVGDALERAARHAPDTDVRTRARRDDGARRAASRLSRAINNLLDNAVKWNAPGAPIEVSLARRRPPRARPRARASPTTSSPHVFDRFFRGTHPRARPARDSAWPSCARSPRTTAARSA